MSEQNFWSGARVLVTGGTGFVGANTIRLLQRKGCEIIAPKRADYDLGEQAAVRAMYRENRPDIVFHLAGLVGGILANQQYPADYAYQNLIMGTMVLHEAWQAGVAKYVSLIGGCSYPANAANPIGESSLWNGYPQAESAPYSLAKAMSVVQAQSYRKQHGFRAIILVPGNLYGPHDNFSLNNSHVIPALIRKFYEARTSGQDEVVAWGSGKPVRDFVFVEDVCEAIVKAAEMYDAPDIINISSGLPVTIRELVETVADLMQYKGVIRWDSTKPDGQMAKMFDVTRMRDLLGYECRTTLRDGLARTIDWFVEHHDRARLDVAHA